MTTTGQRSDAPPTHLPPTAGRVVVGLDGSAASHQALGYAAAVARWQNWTLHIVHTWHVNYPASTFAIGLGEIVTAASDEAFAIVRKAEHEVLGDASAIEVRRSIEEGAPAHTLIELSRGADLLVVGSRGLGGFSSLALGSVGQACVHHAHCPVLIVRPKDAES